MVEERVRRKHPKGGEEDKAIGEEAKGERVARESESCLHRIGDMMFMKIASFRLLRCQLPRFYPVRGEWKKFPPPPPKKKKRKKTLERGSFLVTLTR